MNNNGGNQSILLVFIAYLSQVCGEVFVLYFYYINGYQKIHSKKEIQQTSPEVNINSVVHCSVVINQNCKHSGSEVDLCGNNQQHCFVV